MVMTSTYMPLYARVVCFKIMLVEDPWGSHGRDGSMFEDP